MQWDRGGRAKKNNLKLEASQSDTGTTRPRRFFAHALRIQGSGSSTPRKAADTELENLLDKRKGPLTAHEDRIQDAPRSLPSSIVNRVYLIGLSTMADCPPFHVCTLSSLN
jgi:hypothetical protein